MTGRIIVIFVEGGTDKAFYDALIKYYRDASSNQLTSTKVINLKGIGRYESKVASKIKYEILNKYPPENVNVFCSYDTDVFELGKRPPTNWKIVGSKLKDLGVTSFKEIRAVHMIEDWFLIDPGGILKFLKLGKSPSLKGKSGLEKMKILFKKGNKIYQKGNYSHKFIPDLNFGEITKELKSSFADLEKKLGFRRT